ncbi:ankyrin repeat domain-containing protein [Stenotrophomonas indicatrix]|uniref:ankyrin repeat domain-containing protein n=1 Tax=Stenotrophomonas indicatrix TaxID=2045451 RepID=UPI00344493AE
MAGGFFNRISGRFFERAVVDSKDEASAGTPSQQTLEQQPASVPMPTDDQIQAVLDRLIGPGVKATFKHANGDEPLHYAAFRGDLEASRLLIAAGADVNARGQKGMTPLHMSNYGRNPDVSDLLLVAGANPAIKNDSGQVAGYMDRALYDESKNNSEEGFKARVGVDPSEPIFHAENLQQLKQALAQGASVRDTDVLGRNPLHYAQNGEVVLALWHAGADLSAVDSEGNTPFHTAADDAMHELYQRSGWSFSATTANNRGQVPYDYRDYFEGHRHRDAYEEEEARLEAITAGERSAEERSYVLNIVALVEAGDAAILLERVDPNAELVSGNRHFDIDGDQGWSYNDYAGYSILHEAAKTGNAELCRELVFAGADWNKECRDVGEQGFDNYVNGFRNEPGMKPIDFASDSETWAFLNNAENELRAHNRAKLLDSVLPPANAWKRPEGGFAADAQRQVQAAMAAQGSADGQSHEAPRQRPRF